MKNNKKLVFLGLFLLSLLIIFFVGRVSDPVTGKRHLTFTSDGVSQFRKGLDVSGGTKLVYRISYDKYEKIYTNPAELAAVKKTIETIILKNIDGRISRLGVSDYKAYVQKLDNANYIVVEIGGISDLAQAKEIIGKTLELEFKLQNKEQVTAATIAGRKQLAQKIMSEIVAEPNMMATLVQGRMSDNVFFNYYSGATLDQLPELYKNNLSKVTSLQTGKMSLWEGVYANIENQGTLGSTSGYSLDGYTIVRLLDKGQTTLSGKVVPTYTIADVFVQDRQTWVQAIDNKGNALNGAYFDYSNTSTSQMGEPVVAINFNGQGKDVFCDITANNIGKPMAIFIGGQLLTSPTIQAKICGGTAQIDGSFTTDSAKSLSTNLNEGAMPAQLILMQEEKIAPSLGTHALTGAMIAALVGYIAICIFIFFMYGPKKTVITAVTLLTFLCVLAGFIKLTDYALSLAGIAAIILSIGMSVDANVLIYERLREELATGKTAESAIDHAKSRSWTAIRDGQVSAGLIALVLFSMGSNMFKGFGAMMIVTLLLCLFINVPLVKILLHLFYDKKVTK